MMAMTRRNQRRAGFSLIELLLAVSIVGILSGLAIPNLRNVMARAQATQIAGDIDVVQVATNQFNADQFTWPAEVAQGVTPPGLDDFLPDGFSFIGQGYQMDYERLSPIVVPGDPNTTQLIAVAVVIDTDELSNALVEMLGSSILYSVGRKHTFMIAGS